MGGRGASSRTAPTVRRFGKVEGAWNDVYREHLSLGRRLRNLARRHGAVKVTTYFDNGDVDATYYLHRSVKYPGNLQLTEYDGDRPLRDDEIADDDLTEITRYNFTVEY